MKKRLLASLLCLCLLVGLLPTAALAAEDEPGGETPVVCAGSEADENCLAETHVEGCPLYVASAEETEPETAVNVAETVTADEVDEADEVVPAAALAAEDGIVALEDVIAAKQVSTAEELQKAISEAKDGVETTITMTADVEAITTAIIVPAAKVIVLDMASYKITVSNDFSGRAIENAGTLTVLGNGTIDASNGSNGYGAINNTGMLTIENGTFRGNSEAAASNIRNYGKDAVLVINDGTFDTSSTAVLNYDGLATLNGGTYTTHDHNCSSCGSNWSYVIRTYTDGKDGVYPRLYVNGGTYIGTQGALSSSTGYIEVNDGTFKTVDCQKNHGAIFYALYAAGEYGKVQCIINGGTFETTSTKSRPAVLLGNDNTGGDGGINADALSHIYGGTFIAPEGMPAVKVSPNTAKASVIHGGSYTLLTEAAREYLDPACISKDGEENTVIAPRTENDEDAVATVDDKVYASLQDAIAAAKDGDTVTLLKNTTENIIVEAEQNITLNLNGKTLSGGSNQENAHKSKAAITNNGTITIQDSSNPSTGVIKRDDVKVASAYYVIDNQGTMTIKSGTVMNDSGVRGQGASLIRNAGLETAATLNIEGGAFQQDNFIVIKNDDHGILNIAGGHFISENDSAVQNWATANISGGTIEGVVWTDVWSDDLAAAETNISGDVVITGQIVAEQYSSQLSVAPKVEINGGNLDITSWRVQNADFIDITGGHFSESVNPEYLNNSLTHELQAASGDYKYSYYRNVNEALAAAQPGDTVRDLTSTGEDTTYTVTLKYSNGNDDVSLTIKGGSTITLPEPSYPGYSFRYWSDGTNTYEAGEEVTITANTTFTAYWRSNSSSSGGSSSGSSSTVSVDSAKHGSVTASPKNASKGTTVTITVKPDKGYEVDEIIVTDKNGNELRVTDKGNGKYTFTMPSGKVTVEATFVEIENTPDEDLPFVDVAESAYYADAVAWAVAEGITSGTSATTFSPNASCTRAQMVTFLWRAAGSPKATGSNPFSDVTSGSYYYDAVLWAVENGITSGTSATTFGPDATVTRGQTVTFLYRAAGSPAASRSSFADVSADAYYADAVAWAVSEGITSGTGNNAFSPDADCTRGQIVTFMYRNMA